MENLLILATVFISGFYVYKKFLNGKGDCSSCGISDSCSTKICNVQKIKEVRR